MAKPSGAFRLVSPQMSKEGKLPRHCTNDGQAAKKNISPPLEWYNVPEGTKSFALLVQDLDAGERPWTHWVVFNIPPYAKGLHEGFSGGSRRYWVYSTYDEGDCEDGYNDWKVPGWCGPVLEHQDHRFEFKLFALDEELNLKNKMTRDKLLKAIEGHVIETAILMAIF